MVTTDIFDRFTRIEFTRFKAFKNFRIDLKHFNILVGPNNCGKSTVLTAFRILASAMRLANARNPTHNGELGFGYTVDLSNISIAEENIFFNYEDDRSAEIKFTISNNNTLTLHFLAPGSCVLTLDTPRGSPKTTSSVKKEFRCRIGFVPILGPVEHHEPLYQREAARRALFNYRAARNFRNIWHHYPEKFDRFREVLTQTWPGMDIEKPEVDITHKPSRLHMFCLEHRFMRELFWAGFGFQVWCQMLTHLIQSAESSLFLIDEPDIYLHSELQRQLLVLLRDLGPDVLIATHSTEIIAEAETSDIVLIDKRARSARRLKNPSQLGEVFAALGSTTNPTLTQLAKTRKAVFVEGEDFRIIGAFARKLRKESVSNRRDFAVVPVGGFNPDRIKSLKTGMETTLESRILAAAILDRDYRSDKECDGITEKCREFCEYVKILGRKEIENFVLVPSAIDRAVARRVSDQVRRTGKEMEYLSEAGAILNKFATDRKSSVQAQFLSNHRKFARSEGTKADDAQIDSESLEKFEGLWSDPAERYKLIPGKEAVSVINVHLQETYGVSVTPVAIIDVMHVDEIPSEMRELVNELVSFSSLPKASG